MARRGTRRVYILAFLLVGLGGQAPGAVMLANALVPWLGAAAWPIAIGLSILLTTPLVVRLWYGPSDRIERGPIGVLLLILFAWWGASVMAGLALPATWLIAHAIGGTTAHARLVALGLGAFAGLAGVTLWRTMARVRRIDIPIAGLPPSLDGYRIVQLSDLHMGAFVPRERVRGWVDRANSLDADLIAVTGDLISSGNDFLEAVSEELGRLRGRDGVFVCLGNHDYFGDCERLVSGLERNGLEVLRNRGRVIERSGARYWVGGVDDTWQHRADLSGALAGRPEGIPVIVLAHDPSLFDECAARGVDLTLSGHTHGGQIALPIFPRLFNAARLVYRYTAGVYRKGTARLYVSRGAGTSGPPLRIGAPSEIALLTLRVA